MAPEIPVNPLDLPTDTEPMPDDLTYTGTIIKVGGSAFDKNGDEYFGIQVEVDEPAEWKGQKIDDHYIRLPSTVEPDMDARSRRRAMESGVKLGRLCRSAAFNPGANRWHTDDLIGSEVKFTVRNDKYQGRLVPKIVDYMLP